MVSGLVGVPLDGTSYFAAMPPWLQLTDAQLAAIGDYVLQELNGEKTCVTAAAVKQARDLRPSYAALTTLRDGGG
jgi:mono/diheme cytochrome c family protein